MKKILIFTAGFGEGHNTAARNIRDALEHIAPDEAKVEVLDLFDTCYGKLNDWVRKAYITAINRTPRVWGKIYNVIDGTQFVESNMAMLAKMKRAMSDVLWRTWSPTRSCQLTQFTTTSSTRFMRTGGLRVFRRSR